LVAAHVCFSASGIVQRLKKSEPPIVDFYKHDRLDVVAKLLISVFLSPTHG